MSIAPSTPLIAPAPSSALAVLMGTLRDYLRGYLPPDIKTVDFYGGEFDDKEITKYEFACPAVLITCLGFGSSKMLDRSGGKYAQAARMACFVVTKNATREGRLIEAADLAERLAVLIKAWNPKCPTVQEALPKGRALQPEPQICILPAECESVQAENLYSRKVDDHKLAIWLVSWMQGFEPEHGINTGLLAPLAGAHLDSAFGVNPPAPATAPQFSAAIDSCATFINPP